MSKKDTTDYAGNAEIVVDIFLLIGGLGYILCEKIIEGIKEYYSNKKEVDKDKL